LAECVLQAVRVQFPPSATPPHITLVGHSLGGAVILRMYGHDRLRAEYADVLSRVDSAVLLAPADIRIPQMPPNLRRACEISDVEVVLAQSLGMLPELAAQMEWNGVVNGPSAMVEEAQRDLRLFTDLPHLHAMQSMILHAVPQNHGILDSSAADYWERQYQYLTVPTLVVWGSLDSTLGPSMGYKLQAQLPDARLRILNPAKHCLMIEQPQACIDLIRSFTAGTLGTERIATIPVQPPVPHAHPAQR
ncbi:MAG TPA: alpha/beta hydrolase, partial [Phycisphaerae bacterium]|nr:alpha/beta hydrolase [Phycisphaerae bacterium]